MVTLGQIIEELRADPDAVTTPSYAELSLIGRCNFSCVQCHQMHHIAEGKDLYGRSGPGRLRHDRVMELLDELADLGVSAVELCGRGEPTLYPELPDLIAGIMRRGMSGRLITNGSRLTGQVISSIAANRFNEVAVSIYGGDDKTYASVTGVKSRSPLKAIAAGLQSLKDSAPDTKITLALLLQSEMISSLEGIFELLKQLPADRHYFIPSFPYRDNLIQIGGANDAAADLLAVQLKDAVTQLKRKGVAVPGDFMTFTESFAASPQIDTIQTTYSRVPCYAGKWSVFISDDGTLRPCSNSNWVLGDLYTTTLRDIWYGAEYQRFRAAAQRIVQTRQPIEKSYCTHCGWARIHRSIHDAVTTSGPYDAAWLADPYLWFPALRLSSRYLGESQVSPYERHDRQRRSADRRTPPRLGIRICPVSISLAIFFLLLTA